jgi:hypothetical protein
MRIARNKLGFGFLYESLEQNIKKNMDICITILCNLIPWMYISFCSQSLLECMTRGIYRNLMYSIFTMTTGTCRIHLIINNGIFVYYDVVRVKVTIWHGPIGLLISGLGTKTNKHKDEICRCPTDYAGTKPARSTVVSLTFWWNH